MAAAGRMPDGAPCGRRPPFLVLREQPCIATGSCKELLLQLTVIAAQKVCSTLVHKGQLTLAEISRETGLPPADLRSYLLVLVQHHCVQAYRVEADANSAAARLQTYYTALTDNIRQRLRYPRFLLHIRHKLGNEAEAVVEGLLEHGRLSFHQIVQRAAARGSQGEKEARKSVQAAFVALVSECYIERCPKPEPALPSLDSVDAYRKGQRGQRGRAIIEAGVGATEELRIVNAAMPEGTDRFRLPSSLAFAQAHTNEDGLDQSGHTPATKRRRVIMDCDADQAEEHANMPADELKDKDRLHAEEADVLWKVNFSEILRRFRHQACVEQVRKRIDPMAGTVLEAILDSGRTSESSLQQAYTAPITVEAALQAAQRMPKGTSLTLDRVRTALQLMASDAEGLASRVGEGSGGGQFIRAVVSQRYGLHSCRILGLLLSKKQLEHKQIAEMAMIPIKNARELLYKMLQEEFVQLQEIAKTSDHAPSRTFYLWHVNIGRVSEIVLDSMFKAASNLRQRLTCEVEQEQEVLALLEQMQRSASSGSMPTVQPVTLTPVQRQQLERVRQVAAVLESSLLRLDEAIIAFSDF
eukprot:SM000005S17107  [mRNA]  locus=s5:252079:256648:+ [translate_table: standard]